MGWLIGDDPVPASSSVILVRSGISSNRVLSMVLRVSRGQQARTFHAQKCDRGVLDAAFTGSRSLKRRPCRGWVSASGKKDRCNDCWTGAGRNGSTTNSSETVEIESRVPPLTLSCCFARCPPLPLPRASLFDLSFSRRFGCRNSSDVCPREDRIMPRERRCCWLVAAGGRREIFCSSRASRVSAGQAFVCDSRHGGTSRVHLIAIGQGLRESCRGWVEIEI